MHFWHIPIGCAGVGLAGMLCIAAGVALPRSRSDNDSSGVHIEQSTDALTVKLDGQLFLRYVFAGAPKPYCWPIIGPTGAPVTRAYPMEQIPGETIDHPHQRSLWFTHGSVNGIDFWSEGASAGRQVHRRFEAVEEGPKLGRIRAVNDWIAPDGKKVAEDTRELRIYAQSEASRILDFDIIVRATEGPLVFGDTKEGTFGIRVASTMEVEKGGHIINSRGETNAAAWGKPAEWVDYSGPVNDQTVGITVMNHPSSFRHPTHWHVRTYGLFAANPFGLHDFYADKSKDGSHTVPEGDSITFRYRVLLHVGDAKVAQPDRAYAAFIRAQ